MKKIISLIKANMYENMSLFKIKSRNDKKTSKMLVPILLALICLFAIGSYAYMTMEALAQFHAEIVLLTLFVILTTVLTIIEGIYKSSGLLFNCKDDNLMFSLPIKKSTVLFVRVFKFYLFELLYNSLFLIPAIIVYAMYVNVDAMFYIVSIIAVLLLPIIPIVISCIIGGIISAFASKFKYQNIAQIIITMIIFMAVFYLSFNSENIMQDIAQNATSINDVVTRIYYPAGAYIGLVTEFSIINLLIFIIVNLSIFAVTVFVLSKIYFKINSSVKSIKTNTKKSNYKIKTNKPMKSLIKKELNRFINSPVFVTNAGVGLVMFVIACILMSINFDGIVSMLTQEGIISVEQISAFVPVVLFGLVCFASLMSSITSSMISLEGKAFSFLKSLPVKPFTIISSKVLTAVSIMLPFIFAGDIIVFIRFNFNILEIILISILSIILPLVAETIGILINLKYPKMDAENDTQVVKQSMSSAIAVFSGMILLAITIFVLVKCIEYSIPTDQIIIGGLGIYTLIYAILLIYLKKSSVKDFNKIVV